MSNRSLPDDLSRWPSDPFDLLGVTHRDDAKTVRRAYLRLARRYKPEHHPNHFQRVREAYDIVNGQIELWNDYEHDHDEKSAHEPFEFGIVSPKFSSNVAVYPPSY